MSALRHGYSTGACATALAVAAWQHLQSLAFDDGIPVRFGDDTVRILPVTLAGDRVRVVKDAGDDPDCTHRAVLYARLTPRPEDTDPRDIDLTVGNAAVTLRAVEGIGLCTRPGLDCDPGKWAVNIGPRRMITEHLLEAGLGLGPNSRAYLLELGIENGEKLAEKTLNARLGVLGGLSVLGTTGLVRPYSHDAWIATVRLCARSLAAEGRDTLVLCTGGRTTRSAQMLLNKDTQVLPNLQTIPPDCFVSMGDFLQESLKAAHENALRRVIIACMPGKLCKYAAGYANTHAHKVPQDMDLFRRVLAESLDGIESVQGRQTLIASTAASASVREALIPLPPAVRHAVLTRLAALALTHCRSLVPDAACRILVFDFAGGLLLDTEGNHD